jgi:hypothetical protein
MLSPLKRGQRGGNGLTDGKHLGCGRLGTRFRECSPVWRPYKASTLAVGARLVSLLVVMWGPLRVSREGPSSCALYGRACSRWAVRL